MPGVPAILHPCAAPPDRLRVWLGAFNRQQLPTLSWTLDGASASPQPIRALQSVRDGVFLQGNPRRTFTGVYEFALPAGAPRTSHSVTVSVASEPPVTCTLKPVPAEVPRGFGEELRVVLASCYYRHQDQGGQVGSVFSRLRRELEPDLVILAGDQVYLDLPTLENLPSAVADLAQVLEDKYVRNWSEPTAYAHALALGPSVCTPDDHEYWNNYPHVGAWLFETQNKTSRNNWARVAQLMYERFQHFEAPGPHPIGRPIRLEVEPLSILVLDTRTYRQMDFSRTLMPGALAHVQAWAQHCIDQRRIGVLVTGQTLLDKKSDTLGRELADGTLPDHDDYLDIFREVERVRAAGRDVLLLTGDVHWGRVSQLTPQHDLRGEAGRLFEVISSPTALVTTPGQDQLHSLTARRAEPWKRHADAKPLPNVFAPEGLGVSYRTRTLHLQRGDQAAHLTFRRNGLGLKVGVEFYPMRADLPVDVAESFELRR